MKNETPWFDFDPVIARFGGDLELTLQVLELSVADLRRREADFFRELEAGAWERAIDAIHSVRGTSANAGLLQLAEHARKLEIALTEGNHEFPSEVLDQLRTGVEAGAEFLRQVLESGGEVDLPEPKVF